MSKHTPRKADGPGVPRPKKSIAAQLAAISKTLRQQDAKMNVCMNRTETIIGRCDSLYSEVSKIHTLNNGAISDAYERGKAAAPAPAPEPWRPKVGDVVVCMAGAGETGTGYKPDGLWPIKSLDDFHGDPVLEIPQAPGRLLWYKAHNLRPATEAEIAAYHQKQEERLRREREEAERARPLNYLIPVKLNGEFMRSGVWVSEDCDIHTILLNPTISQPAELTHAKRNEFTILP